MLRQTVRGARWYHVASKLPFSRRTFHAVTAHRLEYGGPNDKVTFYEQDTRGSKTRRKVDPEAEDNEERKEVENELARLQQELKELEKGPFTPDGPFIQSLPEDDRKIALEALRKYEEGKDPSGTPMSLDDVFDAELDDMLREEFEGLALEQENWQDGARKPPLLSDRQARQEKLRDSTFHPYAIRFKSALDRFSQNANDEQCRQDLWKAYRRCKQLVPGFLEELSPEDFAVIFESQATSRLTESSRSTHLQTIAQDITSVGRSLTTPQILKYIQALHDGGATDQALEQWEAYQAELSRQKGDLEDYWMLGVRLFAAEENPQRAQDIALAFLANDKSRQPRILIPVITAWARVPGEDAEVKAWALYLQLKTLLGSSMTMEDYDKISIGLLSAGRLNTAIAVFKDMMVTGRDPANDSMVLYQAALGLAGNLHASSINEQAVNKVSLSALTILPRQYQNRFFYASWMKKLIGMGEVDSAALVVELMYERGVKPDSKHLNGLIAGWLRKGNALARDKAERLGWAMIQHRISTVWKQFQGAQSSSQLNLQHQTVEPSRIPHFLKRDVPPASIETFSILLLHYTRRGDDDMVNYLVKCLGDAKIQPNSYFMNHLLYAELRKQDIHSLWAKFQKMSATIRPDLETYACLWDCAKLQFDRGRTAFDAAFPSARQLYASMMLWYSQLNSRAQKSTDSEFSKELYDQIVRCFCLSKDLPGTLVVLYSLHARFGFAPDDVTARLIVLQIARLAGVPAGTPKHRLRRLSSTPRSKANVNQVNQLLELLGDRKSLALKAQGLSVDQLDPHEMQQYRLEIVANLLRIVLSRADSISSVQVEDKLSQALSEMEVQDLSLGPPLGVDDSQLL